MTDLVYISATAAGHIQTWPLLFPAAGPPNVMSGVRWYLFLLKRKIQMVEKKKTLENSFRGTILKSRDAQEWKMSGSEVGWRWTVFTDCKSPHDLFFFIKEGCSHVSQVSGLILRLQLKYKCQELRIGPLTPFLKDSKLFWIVFIFIYPGWSFLSTHSFCSSTQLQMFTLGSCPARLELLGQMPCLWALCFSYSWGRKEPPTLTK